MKVTRTFLKDEKQGEKGTESKTPQDSRPTANNFLRDSKEQKM